jgi:CheY-like chemotaxis protein
MSGESVLIVEDEGLIAPHISETLEREGFRISGLAYAGEMVLRDFGKSPLPDIILMDIALAGEMDGIEAARRIRQNHDIPVIFLTAYSSRSRIDEATAVSPYGYITKPVMTDDLLTVIRSALDRRPARTMVS